MHQQIKQSILSLKMEGMANLWQSLMETHQLSNLSIEQLLQMLLQAEWEHRQGKKQDRLVRSAHFRYQGSLEEIDWNAKRNLDKSQILQLADCGFITRAENRIHPIDSNVRLELLEIIEDRHGKKSTLISSQLPVAKWYELFEDSTVADALMDRLLHHTIRIDLKGESLRKKK